MSDVKRHIPNDDGASVATDTLPDQDRGRLVSHNSISLPEYLKSDEAAAYLRKSVSWLVKRHDIPYLKGTPNIYRKGDLDEWFERNKFVPSLN